ncbi:PepSY domain-containing protein [Bowmanella sp. JS7-9]|uniref:PepSY domain-containing protein n=1 Tax=Pseudobowmanella zhangzhouensis TaxID=1537679 RepID=A0ABW1XKA9_9ALTE|nr:PepSY domain-containing protein [Bowmanella sp. JS7-9]TBX22475.1 hypothetical protein TK45_08415 [Bowmanella sp. JS7-9]
MKLRVALLVLVCLMSFGQPVMADQQDKISQSQAVSLAQRHTSGRILKVEQSRDSYKIKVLKDNGRVVTLRVDKQTGRVSGPKDKD